VFPPLADNPLLQTIDSTSAINIVLSGSTLPATKTAPSAFTMAPFDWLVSDQDVADVVSFIQTSWGQCRCGSSQQQSHCAAQGGEIIIHVCRAAKLTSSSVLVALT
jgi:hypothetical protein